MPTQEVRGAYLEMRDPESRLPRRLLDLIEDPEKVVTPRGEPPFEPEFVTEVSAQVRDVLGKIPNLARLGDEFRDVLIAGDTHGDIASTRRILQPFFEGEVGSLVFLGDYVDRGKDSLVNLVLVSSVALAWPRRVVLLKGNHEDFEMNAYYGFLGELRESYRDVEDLKIVTDAVGQIYDNLSLAVVTPRGTFGVHGGIPDSLPTLDEVNNIPKPHSQMNELDEAAREKNLDIYTQLLWNDPSEGQKVRFKSSMRGGGIYTFNGEVVDEFLARNGITRVVRAHESARGGYQSLFGGKLVHIFSTEPYFGQVEKACVFHEQADGKSVVRDLDFNMEEELD
ncbi:MAG: metallophosphoesterase [Promethearchaeota archaeon]